MPTVRASLVLLEKGLVHAPRNLSQNHVASIGEKSSQRRDPVGGKRVHSTRPHHVVHRAPELGRLEQRPLQLRKLRGRRGRRRCIVGRLRDLGWRHELLREGAASASTRVLQAKVLAELRGGRVRRAGSGG